MKTSRGKVLKQERGEKDKGHKDPEMKIVLACLNCGKDQSRGRAQKLLRLGTRDQVSLMFVSF